MLCVDPVFTWQLDFSSGFSCLTISLAFSSRHSSILQVKIVFSHVFSDHLFRKNKVAIYIPWLCLCAALFYVQTYDRTQYMHVYLIWESNEYPCISTLLKSTSVSKVDPRQ